MYKVAKVGDQKFVVADFKPDKSPKPLRRGHELRADGIGLGKILVWREVETAKMYADLLNRGQR